MPPSRLGVLSKELEPNGVASPIAASYPPRPPHDELGGGGSLDELLQVGGMVEEGLRDVARLVRLAEPDAET
jgi:hypothetical protein